MTSHSRISAKIMRDAEWKCVYSYVGSTTSFKTYASDAIPGLTITYDKVGSKRTKTTYTISGPNYWFRTESPSQAVRLYNAQIEKARDGRPATGSPEPAGPASGELGL